MTYHFPETLKNMELFILISFLVLQMENVLLRQTYYFLLGLGLKLLHALWSMSPSEVC